MTNLALPADQPLPAPLDPPPLDVPEPDAKVAVEPIALHVPAECFYVRFGSFSNFLWLQDTLDTWGGDLQNLLAQRGLDYERSKHMQDQLILYQTQLSRLLGETVISDVAIIGSDMYFREGAAYGFLFEARNSLLLGTNFSSDRRSRVSRGGVTEQKLKLAGREVSLISSPDGSVRSYYVTSGDYHFVTSSRRWPSVFCKWPKAPARWRYEGIPPRPVDHAVGGATTRCSSIFPTLFSATSPGRTIAWKRCGGWNRWPTWKWCSLPSWPRRPRAAPGARSSNWSSQGCCRPISARGPTAAGQCSNTARFTTSFAGGGGCCCPCPTCRSIASLPPRRLLIASSPTSFASKWGRLDPAMVGLKRESLSGRRERVVIDARLMPFDRRHVDFLAQWVGPADKLRLATVPGNMASGEVVLSNQRLFGGLRDVGSPLEVMRGSGTIWDRFRSLLVGYVGSYGPPGLLGLLDALIPGPPDAAGYASNRLGLWRRQFDRFTVYSLQPEVLATVTPQLHFEQTERPAQARLHVGDIAQARVTPR